MERLDLNIGKAIQSARKERALTAEQLAELCDVNATFLRQVEGGAKHPSMSLFVKICNELHVSPDHLLRNDLTDNKLSRIHELDQLMKSAPLNQQELVLRMLKAALVGTES